MPRTAVPPPPSREHQDRLPARSLVGPPAVRAPPTSGTCIRRLATWPHGPPSLLSQQRPTHRRPTTHLRSLEVEAVLLEVAGHILPGQALYLQRQTPGQRAGEAAIQRTLSEPHEIVMFSRKSE